MARTPHRDPDSHRLLEQGRILELLQLNRARYGTGVMMAEGDDDAGKGDDKPKDDAGDKGKAGEDDDDDLTADELAALGDPGKRALDRLKAKAKTAREEAAQHAADAAKWREQQEASKPEQQRQEEAARAKDARLQETEAELLRLKVALDAGLPHTMAPRLIGKTEAELREDAKALADERAAAGTAATTTTRRRTTSDADKGGNAPGGGMSAAIRGAAGYS